MVCRACVSCPCYEAANAISVAMVAPSAARRLHNEGPGVHPYTCAHRGICASSGCSILQSKIFYCLLTITVEVWIKIYATATHECVATGTSRLSSGRGKRMMPCRGCWTVDLKTKATLWQNFVTSYNTTKHASCTAQASARKCFYYAAVLIGAVIVIYNYECFRKIVVFTDTLLWLRVR